MPEMSSTEMSRSPEAPDEFNYDPLKMYLYKKAIRTGMERESSIRVNIIGNFSQGKTSLTRRLIGQKCEGVISTNGIEIRRFKCRKMKDGRLKVAEDENKDFFDRIAAVARSFDTEKLSERVERIALADTQNNQAVSAITEDHTFSYLQTRFPTTSEEPTQRQIVNTPIASQEPSVRQIVNIPTASQEPTDDRFVTSNVQEQVVNTTQIPSISSEDFKTFSSGVDQENDDVELSFDMWDFGGQYIFYATHTLFHSRKALYLLVVDLSSPLDKIVIDNEFPTESGEKNMEYFIKFWIESIHAFVGPGPPVILVGTHKDQIQGTEEAKQYLDQIRSIFEDTDMIDHIQPEDFAVDNHDCSDTDIPNLLQYLIQKGSELVQTVEIPARWIQLEKKLNENRHKNVITFQDVMKIDANNEYPLKEEEQVKLFLQYHHEKGTLFYFDEEPMSKHVVLDPGFLVDAFKCIITPERFRLNDISIRHLWCSLRDEAKLTDGLINKVWSHNNDGFMKHKMVLLGYLKKHYIISQVVEYDITRETYKEQDWYIVPSLLKDKCPMKVMEDFLREKPRTMVRYFMHFEQTSIVQMLFHRLISAALGKWAILKFGNKQMLFKNLAVFKLQESLAGIAELRYSGIELRVVSLCKTTIGSQVPDGFRRFIEAIVSHEFRKLKSQMGDNAKPFSQKYRCNHKIHDLHGSHHTSDICLLQEKKFVFCPDNYTHKEVSGSEAKSEWFQDESIAIVYPKKNLTEKHLSQLAQAAIGKGWQLLGTELGIKQVEIDHIMEENSPVAMMIFQMLLKWKANSEENATLDVLVESIKKCPSVTVEWDELRNIKDEQSGILMGEHSVFSQTLEDLTVKENDNMFLECAVSKPDVQVMWLKDNEEICTEMRRKKCVEKNIHRLFVEGITNTDAGVYKCVFEDTCTTCTVTVKERKTPTEFLQTLSDVCIEDKYGSASFQCKINKVSVDVKWYHGSQVLSPSEKYQLVDEGPVHMLKIHNVVDTDEGTYKIVADRQTSSATLRIEDTEEERELIRQHFAKIRKSETAPASPKSARLEKNPTKKPADVIEQPVRKTYGDEQFWRFLAQHELDEGKRTLKDLEGVHTVVCLDISASMAKENAWTEAVTFVRDYLNGLEDISTKHGLTNEYVAIVTFGHETKVQKRFTNKYSEMRQLVEMQRLGGPSPIYGGLVLGLAAAGSSEHILEIVSNVQVFTKIIIVTDGHLTEIGQYAGPDTPVENLNETKAKVIQCMEEYKNSHIDSYLVPVGKQNKETSDFLDLMLTVADGRKLNFKSGRQFSRRHYITTNITDPFGILQTPFSLFGTDLSDFSAEDKEMIKEIKDDAKKNLFSHISRGTQNKYREMDGGNFPPIGSRVRRGPDWNWNIQDSYGPGTVIGHDDGEQVWVEWDTDDRQNVYRYGQPGYDVLIVEEPRQLKPGQKIAVGCIVKPGKDFAQPSAKEQFWQRGVVIKLNQPKATVRWDNGERGDYSYGETGKCEIEVCTGFFAFGSEGHVLGSGVTAAPVKKKTRNKNKNVN